MKKKDTNFEIGQRVYTRNKNTNEVVFGNIVYIKKGSLNINKNILEVKLENGSYIEDWEYNFTIVPKINDIVVGFDFVSDFPKAYIGLYKGENKILIDSDKLSGDDKEPYEFIYIVPFEKFDPNNLEETKKWNIF